MRFLRLWWPVVAWMGVIFLMSGRQSISVSAEPLYNFLFFKFLHLCEYALLYVLVYRANRRTMRARQAWWAFFVTVLYAASDELHQSFVPTREGKLRDVIIDAVGASLAWGTISILLPKAPKKLQRLGKALGLA